MKKKMKDLTLAECREICKKYKRCFKSRCPLYEVCWYGALYAKNMRFFNKEVEV